MERQAITGIADPKRVTNNKQLNLTSTATRIKAELIIVAVWIALVGGAYV
jgi:hypothetical protein